MATETRRDPLAFLGDELADLRARHLYRPLRVMSSAQGPIVSVDDRRLISLSSNDYLGLTHHPRLKEAALKAVRDFGAGGHREPAGGSMAGTRGRARSGLRYPVARSHGSQRRGSWPSATTR